MPFKTDKEKLGSPFLSRRVKLIPCQREMIGYWHREMGYGIRELSRMFKVSRRLIQFILFPERKAKDLENRKARGGSKIYYKKEYHKEKTKEHRRHKYNTLKNIK